MKILESYAELLYTGMYQQKQVGIGNILMPVILYNVYEFDWEKEKSFLQYEDRSKFYLLPLWKDTRNI